MPLDFELTVEVHDLLILAERVRSDTFVLAVVDRFDVVDAQAENDPMISVVVRLRAILGRRAADTAAVLLPVVDGVRVGRYDALEDRLATDVLTESSIRHRYLRGNCVSDR